MVLKFVKLSERDRFRDRFLLCSISSLFLSRAEHISYATMEWTVVHKVYSPRGKTHLYNVVSPWNWSWGGPPSGGSALPITNRP